MTYSTVNYIRPRTKESRLLTIVEQEGGTIENNESGGVTSLLAAAYGDELGPKSMINQTVNALVNKGYLGKIKTHPTRKPSTNGKYVRTIWLTRFDFPRTYGADARGKINPPPPPPPLPPGERRSVQHMGEIIGTYLETLPPMEPDKLIEMSMTRAEYDRLMDSIGGLHEKIRDLEADLLLYRELKDAVAVQRDTERNIRRLLHHIGEHEFNLNVE